MYERAIEKKKMHTPRFSTKKTREEIRDANITFEIQEDNACDAKI